MATRRDRFNFTKLRNALNGRRVKVNIMGVVLEHGFPRKSNGTDFYYFVRIIDETYHNPGLPVHLFIESLEKSPHVLSPGDIIELQNVSMKVVGENMSAVYNKTFSRYALYHGRIGSNDTAPYQTCENFHVSDVDITYAALLRSWFQHFPIDQGLTDFSISRDLTEGEHFNLFCKVLYVYNGDGDANQWTLFVWDGSDAPPATIRKKLSEEMNQPLALHVENFSVGRDTLCNFPTLGTVVKVTAQEIDAGFLPSFGIGSWVKIANLMCELYDGLWRVILTRFSRIRFVSRREQLRPEPLRLYDQRLLQNPRILRRLPQWSLPWVSRITDVDIADDCGFHTLMDVVTSPEVMASFKCVVRVVSILPYRATDYHFPAGINKIRLTLEDPTTRIHAFLYVEDAVKFFDGSSTSEQLSAKRNVLLGADASIDGDEEDNVARNPPWVQVCLKVKDDTEDILENIEYVLFGTRVIG